MKKIIAALLLLCLLTGSAAIAEEKTFTPDGVGLLTFGMSRDEVLEAAFSPKAEKAGVVPSMGSTVILHFSEKPFLTGSLYCVFEDEKLAYARRNLNGTVSMNDVTVSSGEYEEYVFPVLAAKYGEGNIARFTEDKYLAVSDLLAGEYGEPMFSSEQGTSAETQEYSDSLYSLTGDTDVIVGVGSQGVYSYKPLRYEQWVLPMPDGNSMLVHHLEYLKTSYFYDEYSNEAEAIADDFYDARYRPQTAHVLQYLPYAGK